MPTNYVPTKDADFGPWLDNAAALATAVPATYGLTAPIAVIISAQAALWAAAYALATAPGTRTPATVAAKDDVRAVAEATVRPYFVQVSQNPAVAPLDKVAFGATWRKTTPTPVPPPTTRPGLNITAQTPLVVAMNYMDVDLPVGKSKPDGAVGLQVFVALGTVYATDPDQAAYKTTWTKSPARLTFQSGDVAKLASIWGRWVTRGGPGGEVQTGPWSDRITTIVI